MAFAEDPAARAGARKAGPGGLPSLPKLFALPTDLRSTKRRVEALFVFHSVFALVAGSLAFALPHVWEFFMIHHGEKLSLRGNTGDSSKVEHEVIRLYGALILGQAWITWRARAISDAHTRRALIQAYFGVFLLTTLALLRAQLTPGGNLSAANWINIALFAGLTAGYGHFAFFEKVAAFEGLGKGLV